MNVHALLFGTLEYASRSAMPAGQLCILYDRNSIRSKFRNNILGLVVITSILDFKSYRLAKSRVGSFQNPVPKIDKIPFYASITSTTTLIPYFFMAMVLGNFISNFSPISKFYTIMVLSTVVNMIRNPLTGLH